MSKSIKLSACALFACFATITFLIENLFPPIIVPGAKMGLSNVFILLAVIILGVKYGFAVLTVKIFLGSLFSGNISQIIYSLPAGIISLTVQCLLIWYSEKISLPAISISGAVINTTVQNFVFCLITTSFDYLYYLPYLCIIGIVSGAIVGTVVYLIVNYINFEKVLHLKKFTKNKEN